MTQPAPTPGGKPVLPVLLEMLQMRAQIGRDRYGVLLATNNGRDPDTDLLDEVFDALFYVTQIIMERRGDYKFHIGQRVRVKDQPYHALGRIVARWMSETGERYVFEFDTPRGLVHIFNAAQLEE